jgi:hypothetical protein
MITIPLHAHVTVNRESGNQLTTAGLWQTVCITILRAQVSGRLSLFVVVQRYMLYFIIYGNMR